jgi:hypothetical protein
MNRSVIFPSSISGNARGNEAPPALNPGQFSVAKASPHRSQLRIALSIRCLSVTPLTISAELWATISTLSVANPALVLQYVLRAVQFETNPELIKLTN